MSKVKLGNYLIHHREAIGETSQKTPRLLGVSNKIGLHKAEKRKDDLSRYTIVKKNYFAYNPMRVNVGSIGIAENENQTGIISPDYVVFSCSKEIYPKFLFHILKSDFGLDLIRQNTTGTVRQRLYFKNLAEIELSLPPYEKQITLVKLIDKVKDLIELLNTGDDKHSIKALRQSILQEAVQGQLTAVWRQQNPNVEPASELLRRIREEKKQLIAEGKLKKQKPLPPVTEEEMPFALPEGWVWCRLGELALYSEAGKSLKCNERRIENGEWGIIKVSAVSWDEFKQDENKFLSDETPSDISAKVEIGDFLISRANTSELVGKSVVVETLSKNLLLSDKTIRFRFASSVSIDYINLVNNGAEARAYYAEKGTGSSPSMKNITREQMNKLIIPLPPLPEQQAIVTRVESLLGRVSALSAESERQRSWAEGLLQAALREAMAT